MLNLTKPTRKKSAWQAYQTLYYADKLKPIVESAYEVYKKNLAEGEVGLNELAFWNKKCQELLELESDEVKVEVENMWVANCGPAKEGHETGSGDDARETELKALQR